MTELSNFFATRPERAEAPSPGHRPGCNSNQQVALNYPGRCPGLGASALSGRAASRTLVLYLSYSFMFESTKLKGRRSLMLSKQ